jgi:DNA repair exonuclease SbcCD ATPase subunit
LALISPWFAVLAGAGVGLGVGALVLRGRGGSDGAGTAENAAAERVAIEREYAALAGDGTIVWEREEVLGRLDALESERTDAKNAAKRLADLADARARRDAAERELEEEGKRLSEKLSALGIAVPADDLDASFLLERLKRVLDASMERERATAAAEARRKDLSALTGELAAFLRENGRPAPDSPLDIKAEVERLSNDIQRALSLREKLKGKRADLERTEKRLEKLKSRLDSWLSKRSLPKDEPAIELSKRLDRLDEYKSVAEERRSASSLLNDAIAKLDDDAKKRVDSADPAGL